MGRSPVTSSYPRIQVPDFDKAFNYQLQDRGEQDSFTPNPERVWFTLTPGSPPAPPQHRCFGSTMTSTFQGGETPP